MSTLQILASNVPWFDAGGVLIIVALWWAALANLDDLEGYVQVLLIAVLLAVTVFFGVMMQQRFQLARNSTTTSVSDRLLLDRISVSEPTLQQYRSELESLPEIQDADLPTEDPL
jgi:hypothetical protein